MPQKEDSTRQRGNTARPPRNRRRLPTSLNEDKKAQTGRQNKIRERSFPESVPPIPTRLRCFGQHRSGRNTPPPQNIRSCQRQDERGDFFIHVHLVANVTLSGAPPTMPELEPGRNRRI